MKNFMFLLYSKKFPGILTKKTLFEEIYAS